MNKQILVILLSSTAFTFSAFAQSTSSSNGQSSSTGVTYSASGNADSVGEPLREPKAENWWDGDDPNVVNLVTHPFARKEWIKRQIGPIRDRIDELDQITTENAAKIKDIDARSQHGIQLASEKVNLADQHASEAGPRSQGAQDAATQASNRVTSTEKIVGNLDQYKAQSQTEIRFRLGQTVLSKQAKDVLDTVAAPLKNEHGYIIEVRGFYPGRGQAAITTSQNMADSVMRYLVETHQIPVYRISVLGMGNATTAGEHGAGRNVHPRVEVTLLKNDVMTTAQR
jgi:outer membrane protein OmpA-like peptidoglycan-associated protein